MELPTLRDANSEKLFKRAKDFYSAKDYINALEIIEDLRFVQGNDRVFVNVVQGQIFKELAEKTENTDVKVAYLLGSVQCLSIAPGLSSLAAISLFILAQQLDSVMYYKKSVRKAKETLYNLTVNLQNPESTKREHKGMLSVIEIAESRIAESKTRGVVKNWEQKEDGDTRKSEPDFIKELMLYWAGLNVEIKRNFMKVSTAELTSYVEGLYGSEGVDALEQVLTFAREEGKWRFWMCRSCSNKFSSAEECKNHLEQQHHAKFLPNSTKHMPQRISKVWSRKISIGSWQPVDAAAAIELIKNRLEDVKAFAYENGWSKDWPLAADEERSKLLKEIQLLLVSFCDHKILSCSVRDWVVQFLVNHLEKLEVSKHILTDSRLVETPQSICFLECCELNQILEFLKNIKCERDDGTNLVCRAVDSFCGGTRVKEKIDFDPQFSVLLLDKRLLQCKISRFDDEGTINVFDPSVHYANAHAQGGYILSWLVDNSSEDESFRFPTPVRMHNLDIWVAVLKAVQFACWTLATKYANKWKLLDYDASLTAAKKLCISEDVRRRNLHKDQWNSYASLLCDTCEENLRRDAGKSLNSKLFLCAVQDVFKGASFPSFDFLNCMTVIREHKDLSDDIVMKSIDLLKLAVTNKVVRIDSKILLVESARINLLNNLTKLSVFDYRSYILRPMKELILDGIIYMENKAKLAAAEAELISEEKQEEEMKLPSKKKKNKSNKKNSTSMSSHLDKTVEHEHSVNLELESTFPSLKPAEEDIFSSERGLLEMTSKTNNQEETTKACHLQDMQSRPGEDSLSKHPGSIYEETTTKYNSILDMVLKALCNLKVLKEDLVHNRQPFYDNQVPCALRDFFSAFVAEQIEYEGLYSYLLSGLLASLKEVHPMSNDAAKVVVAILEFWQCWKSPQRESLVTRLFTLEEYERMKCSKCRKMPNYPEQRSYGIVMAADSIRDLKCAFGNIKFGDIIKVIRMEDKMLCDVKTRGCGNTNFVRHTISSCPPIFTIVLEWEKNESEKEISETLKALDWEIDISRLYEGLEPNTSYRLVSVIGCGEEGEQICMAYKKNRWVSLRHEALKEEVVGIWKSVVRFCGERRVRPEILFYEAARLDR
ncbi:Papain-like cysteine peptidase superfamily [Arabidopsis suecica]|uniref:Papain-like cysteine peptidase superfamily n=1 Tax=Arabidopsis suecica TaxID=45249 RepID=A0A8T2BSC4_ARASU|nr:Papain-like cysteine peptidase superfamily [Arabidopsis suecica]